MTVVLVNGSTHAKGCTYTALKEISKTLNENGIKTEFFQVGLKPIAGCCGCGQCKKTGFCEKYKNDKVNEFLKLVHEKNYAGYVFGSPVHYAAASGSITSFMDRAFYAYLQEHEAGKPAAAIVNARRGGCSATFDQLNKYFTISNMPVISSQYWNETHGFTPKEQQRDLEGLQTMRTLGRNMAWLIKCIQLGKEHGVEFPKLEKWQPTHFIQ